MWLVFRELPIFQTVSAQVVEEEEKFSVHVYRDLPREVDGSLSCSGHVLFSIIGDGLNPMRTYLDYLVGMNIHQLFWCSPGYQGLDPQPIGDMLESFVPTDTRESPLPSSSIGGYHPIFFSDFFHQTSTYLKVFFGAFVVCRSDENFLATWSGVLHGIWDHSPTPDLSGIRCSLAGSVSRWAPGRESASAHGTLLPLLRFTRISCLDGLDGWFAMLEWVNEGQSIHIFYTINIHKLDHHLEKTIHIEIPRFPSYFMVFSQQKGQGELTQTNGILGLDKWSNQPRSCIRHQHDDHLRNWYWHILTADFGHKWYKWWSFVDTTRSCNLLCRQAANFHALSCAHPEASTEGPKDLVHGGNYVARVSGVRHVLMISSLVEICWNQISKSGDGVLKAFKTERSKSA